MAGEDERTEGVEPEELTKEVVEKPEAAPPVKSSYDDFVEGVAARDIAKAQGAEPGRTARIFQTEDGDGGKTVHLAGSKDIVSELGDTMERGGYRVQEWHIRRPDDVSRESEKVRPALDDLIRNIPTPILDNPEEFMRKALGLPLRALEAANEVVEEAAEALQDFSKGGEESGTEE